MSDPDVSDDGYWFGRAEAAIKRCGALRKELAESASEIERLREALKPLAKSFEEQIKDPELKRLDFHVNIRVNLTIEQGLLALAALSTPKESLPVEEIVHAQD